MTVTDTPVPAHDQAERQLIGALLLSRHARGLVVEQMASSDFHQPWAACAFDAIVALHGRGEAIDYTTVAEQITRAGFEPYDLMSLSPEACAPEVAPRLAAIIVEYAGLRRLMGLCAEYGNNAREMRDLAGLVEAMHAELDAIPLPSVGDVPGVFTSGELSERGTKAKPWVIPGLLREQWRAVVVAGEGEGKSLLLAQFALCAAEGIHPLTYREMPAVDTLLIDAENPDDVIDSRMRPTEPGTCIVWHRTGGVNIRDRRDRGHLETLLERHRPALVCMGPLYKMHRRSSRESAEDSALAVVQILDELRERFGFALLMEQHAPHGSGGSARDMRPIDSSLWLRWPEFGIALVKDKDRKGSMKLERFRGDRVNAAWPQRLDRGDKYPWVGRWDEGGTF